VADVAESTTVAADAATLYAFVSDVTRMGEWSPETTSCRWVKGSGPVVGARFRGSNKRGWRRWATTCTVTDAEPGRRFAFHVTFGPIDIADWSYDFEPTANGTLVTESWSEARSGWFRLASKPVMGAPDQAAHNRAGMQKTLTALKRVAESGG
jgi:hypothetical protein